MVLVYHDVRFSAELQYTVLEALEYQNWPRESGCLSSKIPVSRSAVLGCAERGGE